MKEHILKFLRAQNTIVSGEVLRSAMGLSRVSVWKHIHKLQEYGYDIKTIPNRYRLIYSPYIHLPWEFPDRGFNIVNYPE